MQTFEKNYLFLVVLGGRANKANVELHDVRWVVGSRIEDTYDVLRKDWFGSPNGLHIDSYKRIKYVDGYRINLKKFEQNKIENNQLLNQISPKKYLWFVNIGGYSPNSMQEKHDFGFVVASDKLEAKNFAKSKWLIGCENKHTDDIASLKILISCDNCNLIKKIGNWEIELIPEKDFVEEPYHPDWYGFKRIDRI